jgi:hypothetical protein
MLTDFLWDEAKKQTKTFRKKWPTQKNLSFSKPPILNIFFLKKGICPYVCMIN